jgi:hypothetical protein
MQTVLDSLTQYYGLDWAAILLSFFSLNALKNKQVIGFVYGALGCMCALILSILIGSIPMIVANIIFVVMQCRGYLAWKKDSKPASE